MDTLFAYRGTKDLNLDLLEEVYIAPEAQYLKGEGMYLSQNYESAKQYSMGYKKWGVIAKYKIQAKSVIGINRDTIEFSDGDHADLEKLLSLSVQLFDESEALRRLMSIKTVQDYPEYYYLSSSEQDEILQKVMSHNETVSNQFKDHPDILKAEELMAQYRKLDLMINSYLNKNCDVLMDLDTDMLVVKNPQIKLVLLSVDLCAEEQVLKSIYEELKIGNLTSGYLKDIEIQDLALVNKKLQELRDK